MYHKQISQTLSSNSLVSKEFREYLNKKPVKFTLYLLSAFWLMYGVFWLFVQSTLARHFGNIEMLFVSIGVLSLSMSGVIRTVSPSFHQPRAIKGLNACGFFVMTGVYFVATVSSFLFSQEGREIVYTGLKTMSLDWQITSAFFLIFWVYSIFFFYTDMVNLIVTRLNNPKSSHKGMNLLVVVTLSLNTALALFAFFAWSPQSIGETCYSATIMVLCAKFSPENVVMMQQFWFSMCVLAAMNWIGWFASLPSSQYKLAKPA